MVSVSPSLRCDEGCGNIAALTISVGVGTSRGVVVHLCRHHAFEVMLQLENVINESTRTDDK